MTVGTATRTLTLVQAVNDALDVARTLLARVRA